MKLWSLIPMSWRKRMEMREMGMPMEMLMGMMMINEKTIWGIPRKFPIKNYHQHDEIKKKLKNDQIQKNSVFFKLFFFPFNFLQFLHFFFVYAPKDIGFVREIKDQAKWINHHIADQHKIAFNPLQIVHNGYIDPP